MRHSDTLVLAHRKQIHLTRLVLGSQSCLNLATLIYFAQRPTCLLSLTAGQLHGECSCQSDVDLPRDLPRLALGPNPAARRPSRPDAGLSRALCRARRINVHRHSGNAYECSSSQNSCCAKRIEILCWSCPIALIKTPCAKFALPPPRPPTLSRHFRSTTPADNLAQLPELSHSATLSITLGVSQL